MKFTKMHGCGNDYVYVNCFEERVDDPASVAVRVSSRNFGIGSDGLILICPSETADFEMRMFNADGSEGSMCGNGIRCVGKYVYDFGLTDREEITVSTKSGVKTLRLFIENGKVAQVRVNMGEPVLDPELIPVNLDETGVPVSQDMQSASGSEKGDATDVPIMVQGRRYRFTGVSMGNPHAVIYVDDVKHLALEKIGPDFECHPAFPERVNTEFIQVEDTHTLRMRVWERGSGETLACGTGACASVVASILNKKVDEGKVLVHLLGGDLEIEWDHTDNCVYMTGPAETVFTGEIEL